MISVERPEKIGAYWSLKAMTNTINSTTSPLDAVACLLMAKAASRMERWGQEMFWETLPDRIPDLEAHLPALIFTIRNQRHDDLRDRLSSHPLPAVFSPKAMAWRSELVTVWEKRLKADRDWVDTKDMCDLLSFLENQYVYSLRGLTRVDRCGMPPGVTCSSVLPRLLNEARYLWKHSMGIPKLIHAPMYKCLAVLAEWRPAPNVMVDRAVLKAWGEFWLELHQEMEAYQMRQEDDIGRDVSFILKGVAAKALLNLMETRGEEEMGIPVGMESLLLKSLMQAVFATGRRELYPCDFFHPQLHLCDLFHLRWLSWQPQDVTRFPVDRLAELPKILLRIFSFSCQNLCQHYHRDQESWAKEIKQVTRPFLTELIRWDTSGLLAACGIDLLPSVVTDLNNCLDKFGGEYNLWSEYFLNHEVCRRLVRHEVANIEGGREFLQKLENQWQYECEIKSGWEISRCIAWSGRMELQCTGLATETVSHFHDAFLKAIKSEIRQSIRVVLSLWSPGKDAPGGKRTGLKSVWKRKLKSHNDGALTTAALFLLGSDPTDNLIARREKLLNILPTLPEKLRIKLSIADITNLMGELLPWNPNAAPDAKPNRGWQFRPDEMRFRVPTEPDAPTSTPATVQTTSMDRTVQRTRGSEAQLCLF